MFKRLKLIIFIILAALIATSINFVRHKYLLPIVMYHSIDPAAQKGDLLAITPETFERQMRFLKEHHYNVIPLSEAAAIIGARKAAPPNSIAITFDDGYKDNYTYAFPILKKYNFPATIFIIVDEIGVPERKRVSWEEMLIMQGSGLITFGSHTLTHPWLPQVASEERLKDELRNSKRILEEKLGRSADLFCYPGGRFNERARQAVIDAGYQAAVATNPGKKFSDNDVFTLKRIRISQNCGNLFIFWVETSGYYNFLRKDKSKYGEGK